MPAQPGKVDCRAGFAESFAQAAHPFVVVMAPRER